MQMQLAVGERIVEVLSSSLGFREHCLFGQHIAYRAEKGVFADDDVLKGIESFFVS